MAVQKYIQPVRSWFWVIVAEIATNEPYAVKKLAEACVSRTHRRQVDLPPAGFEDREDHRTPCASVRNSYCERRARYVRQSVGSGES